MTHPGLACKIIVVLTIFGAANNWRPMNHLAGTLPGHSEHEVTLLQLPKQLNQGAWHP